MRYITEFAQHAVSTVQHHAQHHVQTKREENVFVDALLQPVLFYSLVIGLAIFCMVLPFLGWYLKSCSCGIRSCPCIKKLFRCIGVDTFDDFETMFLVHEAVANSSSGKLNFCVRITAGSHSVQTEYRQNSVFQENLVLSVAQGTREIKVELVDGWRRKVATLMFDPQKDILDQKGCAEKVFAMRVKQKGVINPQVKLTFRVQSRKGGDEESGGMASSAGNSDRTLDFLVSEQLRKVGWSEKVTDPGQQLVYLATACAGPVERFGLLGEKQPCVLGVRGPPKQRRFVMGLWKDMKSFDGGADATVEIDLLRVTGVRPDPGRAEVFFIYYVDENRVRQNCTLRRVDRTREVWVKLLTMLISELHALKQKAHEKKERGS